MTYSNDVKVTIARQFKCSILFLSILCCLSLGTEFFLFNVFISIINDEWCAQALNLVLTCACSKSWCVCDLILIVSADILPGIDEKSAGHEQTSDTDEGNTLKKPSIQKVTEGNAKPTSGENDSKQEQRTGTAFTSRFIIENLSL